MVHPTYDRTLLKILLPEERDVRLYHVEQLTYHRRDLTKMSRPESAAERLRELARLDEGIKLSRIDFLRSGREDNRNSGAAAQFFIALEVTRIRAQILAWPQLSWIDEDADYGDVALRRLASINAKWPSCR